MPECVPEWSASIDTGLRPVEEGKRGCLFWFHEVQAAASGYVASSDELALGVEASVDLRFHVQFLTRRQSRPCIFFPPSLSRRFLQDGSQQLHRSAAGVSPTVVGAD
jgi:hypothetical protein